MSLAPCVLTMHLGSTLEPAENQYNTAGFRVAVGKTLPTGSIVSQE